NTDPPDAGSGPFSQYLYDDAGHLLGEYTDSGELISEHVWLDDTPVALIKPSEWAASHGGQSTGNVAVFAVEPDHLDTPRLIANASHQTVWRWDSSPFGDTPANEAPSSLASFSYSLRFPGQQYDPETQSHYNYFRDYEPGTGRYLESDPIGQWSDFQTYQFVRAAPLRYSDWTGLALEVQSLGSGISRNLSIPSPCKKGMSSNAKGRAGEAAMELLVGALGYIFQPSSTVSPPGKPTVRPDGFAFDPNTGKTYLLDSKCGPCAKMPKNQRTTYPSIAKQGPSSGYDDVILF
ncbi:RHS repeat domain-containing protein, partial [Dokdonella immobilis]